MKVLVAIFAFSSLLLHSSSGLRCFSCDTETSDGLCTNSPGTIAYGTVQCSDETDEYCYTTWFEEAMSTGIKLNVNRNCCKVEKDSPVCPPGDSYQEVDRLASEGYRITYLRCNSDLCNDEIGDDEEEADYGTGALIVEGNHPEYDSESGNIVYEDTEEEEEEEEDYWADTTDGGTSFKWTPMYLCFVAIMSILIL